MYNHQSSEWRYEPKPGGFTTLGAVDTLVVHYIGSGSSPTSKSDIIDHLRSVYRGHMNHPTERYTDIAYNAAVDQNGESWELRGMQFAGGATFGANGTTKAVLWIGGTDSLPSDVAIKGIAQFYREQIFAGHLLDGAAIRGHRDYLPTSCPGDFLYNSLLSIRSLATDHNKPVIVEDETVPSHITSVAKSFFGCFQGIYRQLSYPELVLYQRKGVETIVLTAEEFDTLAKWGRVVTGP